MIGLIVRSDALNETSLLGEKVAGHALSFSQTKISKGVKILTGGSAIKHLLCICDIFGSIPCTEGGNGGCEGNSLQVLAHKLQTIA